MELKEKGFIITDHKLFHALLVLDFTNRERKIVELVYRFSFGCNREWALLIPADFKVINIKDNHIGGVLEQFLPKKIILKNGNRNEYKLNIKYILLLAEDEHQEQLERINDILHKNLKEKSSQNRSTNPPEKGVEDLPKEDAPPSQNRNNTPLPDREVLASKNEDFLTPKDILKKSIYSDRYTIANKISSKEGSQ